MAYIDTKYLGQCKTCRHYTNSGCNTFCDCGERYSPYIVKIPTADVVEVVRCRNCGMSRETEDERYLFCMNFADTVDCEAFCSYGKRRDT